MYVDDQGVAKELPVNTRGSMIAQSCGMAVQVIGDAFIARQFDDDEGFKRFDFKMSDLNTDLPWFKAGKKMAYTYAYIRTQTHTYTHVRANIHTRVHAYTYLYTYSIQGGRLLVETFVKGRVVFA
jgi:hypothetical protein